MPRAGLSTELVVDAAERLADEVGFEQLTLAITADRLGVRVPSLYKHIAGLDALRGMVVVRAKIALAAELGGAAVGRSADDAVDAIALAYRDWATRHPGLGAAAQRAPVAEDAADVEASDRVARVVYDALAGYGLSGNDAIDATRAFRSAVFGFVALEAAKGFGLPAQVDRSFGRLCTILKSSYRNWPAIAAEPFARPPSGAGLSDPTGSRK